MADNIFNSMELDAIGEVMNISLGSSATAVSNLLDHRVEITTPRVSVCDVDNFSIGELQPAIGVEIRYVSGLEGSNIMLLKRSDVKVIVDILMGSETPDEEFELNELTISAVCEVMNQMMGAASTALSDFLGFPVNISTPESFELEDFDTFKKEHFPVQDGNCVVVRFMLNIEGTLQSEFINVMSVDLTRELLSGLGLGDDEDAAPPESTSSEQVASPLENSPKLSQEEIERLMTETPSTPQPTPQPTTQPSGGTMSQAEIERLMSGVQTEPQPTPQPSGGTMSQAEIERLMNGMQTAPQQTPPPQQPAKPAYSTSEMQTPPAPAGTYPMPPYGQYAPGYYPPPGYYPAPPQMAQPAQPAPRMIQSSPAEMPRLASGDALDEQQAENLDLLMSVPLEVSVEIGRARRKVQDVLAFTKGSLVMLNKLAGDQVDLFVNGQCIAKGDVVVVDDNFGIRITEVLKSPDPNELVNG
ncbi:CheC-like family protein [anaerobic digester metagenome]|uniref:flagellar motor switch protein FliN n=1 Tax=Oscillibacter ruminantium TaxID=1263547 RepID=UPI002B207571|nr:flagellar motor switch protein FliN [Oscillibacter ruminantium]MEA5041270.1 flagellar motor switch protein FliN [Oscillibacter ruminantium]